MIGDVVPFPLEHQGVLYPDVPADRARIVVARRWRLVGAAPTGALHLDDGGAGLALWDPTQYRLSSGNPFTSQGTRFVVRLLRFGCGMSDAAPATQARKVKSVTWNLQRLVVDKDGTENAAVATRELGPVIRPQFVPGVAARPCDYFGTGGVRSTPVLPFGSQDVLFSDFAKLKVLFTNDDAGNAPTATNIVEAEAVLAVWELEQGEPVPND